MPGCSCIRSHSCNATTTTVDFLALVLRAYSRSRLSTDSGKRTFVGATMHYSVAINDYVPLPGTTR